MGFKTERVKAGKSVKDVTELLGVTDAAVYQWENGVYTPRPDKLVRLAQFYGCTVEDLLRAEPSESERVNA